MAEKEAPRGPGGRIPPAGTVGWLGEMPVNERGEDMDRLAEGDAAPVKPPTPKPAPPTPQPVPVPPQPAPQPPAEK